MCVKMVSRRDFLNGALWMGATAFAGGCSSARFFGNNGAQLQGFRCPPMKRIRVGIVGLGARGAGPVWRLPCIPGVEVTAICDIVREKIDAQQKKLVGRGFPRAKEYFGPEAYKALCEADDVDVVYQATPWDLHTKIALYAMEHGKHALTEVPAAMTLDECWAQVETAERTRRHCMMLENCCYGETELLALNLCRKGLLGDLVHGEAAYVHDLSSQALRKEGDIEWWRLDWNAAHRGNQYPTHGLGPVCQYMGINRGDQFDYLVSLESRQARFSLLAETKRSGRYLGRDIAMGDMNMTLIRTKLGRSILLAHDVSSARPYTRYNTIQGTKGILADYPYRVAFEKDVGDKGAHEFLDPYAAEKVRQENMHPIWRAAGELGKRIGGHGGMDFVMDLRWCYCMLNGLPLDMDVYDLAAWCSMCELTERSVCNRSDSVDCVDFTRGAWRTTAPLGIGTIDMSRFKFKNIGAQKDALNV